MHAVTPSPAAKKQRVRRDDTGRHGLAVFVGMMKLAIVVGMKWASTFEFTTLLMVEAGIPLS
jgi:hypothetical protein